MKKVLFILLQLFLTFLITGCSKKADFEEITDRNGLGYLGKETKPYTGKVVKFDVNDRQILDGDYKDGFKVGKWTYNTYQNNGTYEIFYDVGDIESILFYESDSTGPLNNRLFFEQGVYIAVVGRMMADFFENRYTKNVLEAIGTTTNIGFLSLIDMDSLKMKDGGFFYQNTMKYDFFKYPEEYAQIKNNMLNGDYYNWEDQELKVFGSYENNKKTGLWENRSYSIDKTNSFSILMYRNKYVDDGDTLMQERVILHKNLEPLIEIYYKGNRPYSSFGYWESSKSLAYDGGFTYGRRSRAASSNDVGIMSTHTSFSESSSLDAYWTFYRPNGNKWSKGIYAAGERCFSWEYFDLDGNLSKKEECELSSGLVGSRYGSIFESDCSDEIISVDKEIKINPVRCYEGNKIYNMEDEDSFYFPEYWYGAYFE
jgi:hypothetical protein